MQHTQMGPAWFSSSMGRRYLAIALEIEKLPMITRMQN